MKFIRDTIVRSVVVYVTIFVWQIVKSWFTCEVDPAIIDIVLSFVGGWFISSVILNRIK